MKARRIILFTRRTLAALVVLLVIVAVLSWLDGADLLLGVLVFVGLPLLFLWAVLTVAQGELDHRSSRASRRPEP
jgi:L-asparagine transporter-like permease